jgi:hypothetical protein
MCVRLYFVTIQYGNNIVWEGYQWADTLPQYYFFLIPENSVLCPCSLPYSFTKQEVVAFFDKVRNDSSFAYIRNIKSIERLDGLEKYFIAITTPTPAW